MLWFAAIGLILIKPIRMQLLTKPFFVWFQRENPQLSLAEQQVIEAGGVWWGNELFTGAPDWQALSKSNPYQLTGLEKKFLENEVNQLCDLLDEWEICHEQQDLPAAAWQLIKDRGFWGLELETEYGGHGFSPVAHSVIISKIATKSVSAAITVMVPNSLGPGIFLQHYGTPEQKQKYLPRLARGEEVTCFALTGIEAGSDAASITDTGEVCYGEYRGKRMLGVRLNWQKRYITLAPVTTLIGLAFHMLDPDHLLSEVEDIGITLALVPADLPGVKKGSRHLPLNLGFMNGPLRGKDVFIPFDLIIGGIERRGQGWQMMMECLVVGRGISLPSLATAISQFCTRMTSAYSLVRWQFHRPILHFEGVQQAIGRMCGLTFLSEALRSGTIEAIQSGFKPAVASAITKYHLTEFARQIVADAMDVHGGRGIQMGPNNYLSFLHDAVPISITVEGANILTRSLIIFGQGVLRCHPYLKQELQVAANQDANRFDTLFFQHMGFTFSQIARLLVYGLTGGRFIRVKSQFNAVFNPYLRQLTRMSNAFAVLTDITLLVLGKRLKIKEALSARLGDVLSYMCMIVSVLKYYHEQAQDSDLKIFVDWAISFCFGQVQEAMMGFLANFPSRWIAILMRRIIFPWGNAYSGPQDQAATQMANACCDNLSLRERLTQHCYLTPESPAWKMEHAFRSLLECKTLLQKININKKQQTFKKIATSYLSAQIEDAYHQQKITLPERDQLQRAADLCWQAIQVNEFAAVSAEDNTQRVQ
ncbi:MAG: acyl-CoA dehydrogenase [Proteobacteria bacterium]|nr:acyl-CoA dehydrogenase [Pseudomonadota bacterium]